MPHHSVAERDLKLGACCSLLNCIDDDDESIAAPALNDILGTLRKTAMHIPKMQGKFPFYKKYYICLVHL